MTEGVPLGVILRDPLGFVFLRITRNSFRSSIGDSHRISIGNFIRSSTGHSLTIKFLYELLLKFMPQLFRELYHKIIDDPKAPPDFFPEVTAEILLAESSVV